MRVAQRYVQSVQTHIRCRETPVGYSLSTALSTFVLKTRAASRMTDANGTESEMAKGSSSKPRRKRSENLDLERMRRLYHAMLRCSRATRNSTARMRLGTEVPALLDLRGGDLLVTSEITPAIQLLAGGRQPLHVRLTPTSASSLPVQLGVASGIAFRARAERSKALVTVFANAADRASWRESLRVAAEHKLPALFFLFSSAGVEQLVADAQAAGVASMMVDASDSVAVYRICQEAQVRARMGDGPAFIAAYAPRSSARTNPLQTLAAFLREHKYPVDEWETGSSRRSVSRRRPARGRAATTLPFHVITIQR